MARTQIPFAHGVFEMAKEVKLKITQEHIDKGCRRDSKKCALWLAVEEQFPDAIYKIATLREVAWSVPSTGKRWRFWTPPIGAKYIRLFDSGAVIEPMTIRLQDGIVIPMGWKAKHPGSTRKARVYQKRKGNAGVRYTRHRSFGANNLSDDEKVFTT